MPEISVYISKGDKILKSSKKDVNFSSVSIKDVIKEIQVFQKATNEFLTELVTNEGHGKIEQEEDNEDVDDDDEEIEKETIEPAEGNILKRKLEGPLKDDKKIKTKV